MEGCGIMRRGLAVLLLLPCGIMLGCMSSSTNRATSLLNPLRNLTGPTGDDVVQLDIAVVERPIGDAMINDELWNLADEQTVAFETKALLEDNGLRAGLLGGMPPASLQAMLTSERSCANPRRLRLHAGNPTPVALGATVKECKFELHGPAGGKSVELKQAQCQLQVVPVLAENGKITLRFTPLVKHGASTLAPQPLQEPAGTRRWELLPKQPTESYTKLTWELTVSPNEYVVVGARLDRPDTLGQSFMLAEGETPVQRLLVIRSCRPETGMLSRVGILSKAPPLAFQAGWSAARGTPP